MSWSDNFSSFSTSDWTLHQDATYNSTGNYVKINESGGSYNGSVEYDYGIGSDDFNIQFTAENAADGGDAINCYFYGTNLQTEGYYNSAYFVDYNHYDDAIKLVERDAGTATILKSVSQTIGAEKFTGEVDYNGGTVTVYFNGTQVFQYTISSPTQYGNGMLFYGWDGSVHSDHYLHDVTITENLNAPSGVSQTVNSNDSIDVSWTDNAWKSDNFQVQINRDGTGFQNPAGGPTNPTASPANYGPNSDQGYQAVVGMDSSFQWRVRAENRHGNSGYPKSGTKYTTPVPPHNPSVNRPNGDTIEISWTANSDYAPRTDIEYRKDTGSGYGAWTNAETINASTKGTQVTRKYTVANDTWLETDARYQFRVAHYIYQDANNDGTSELWESDYVYTDYGNNGNVYFHDDFSSGDTSNWTSLNVSNSDADVGVNAGATPTLNPSGTDIQPVTAGYQCNLDAGSSLVKNLGDLSGESDVYVRVRFAVSSLDSSSEDARPIEWYDGSAWNTLKTLGSEANRQGYVDLHATVSSTLLSTDNRLRVRGYGYIADHAEVDEVIVSDILHEYTTPTAPSNPAVQSESASQTIDGKDTATITIDWTGNETFSNIIVYDKEWRKSTSSTWDYTEWGGGKPYTIPESNNPRLEQGEQYDIRVGCFYNQYRHGSLSSSFWNWGPSITETTPLPAVSNITIDIEGGQYLISWTNNHYLDDADPHVYISTDGGSTWTDDSGALTTDPTSYTTSSLSSADTHTLKVQIETPDAVSPGPIVTEVLAGSTARRESGATKANESGVVLTE